MLCCRGCWAESGVGGRGTPATQANMTARRVHPPVGKPTKVTRPGSKCSPVESMPSAAKEKASSLRMHSKLRQPCMGRGSSTSREEPRRACSRGGHCAREPRPHVVAIGLRDKEGALLRGRPVGGPLVKPRANKVGRRLVVGEGLRRIKDVSSDVKHMMGLLVCRAERPYLWQTKR